MADQYDLWPQEILDEVRRQRMLPVQLGVLPAESLSSWIVRLADAHGMSVHMLSRWLMGRGREVFGEDVDRGAWDDLAVALVAATGRSREELKSATLLRYEGELWGEMPRQGPVRWVLPIVKNGTFRAGYGVQFCPLCLAEDEIPYFRLHWRLAFVVSCPVHACMLADRCHRCGMPVAAHRWRIGRLRELGTTGIVYCHGCGADRRRALPTRIPSEEIRTAQFRMQAALSLAEAFVDDAPTHSVAFFSGAAMAWSMLDDARLASTLWPALELAVPSSVANLTRRYGGFEGRDLAHRAEALVGFERFLSMGATEVFRRLRGRGASSADVMRYSTATSSAPYWYWRAAKTELDRTSYVPSDVEIENAINHATRSRADGFARVADVCRLLGMATSSSARVARAMRAAGVLGRDAPRAAN